MQTVLQGYSIEQQRKYFNNEGSFSSDAWDNRQALEAWLGLLEHQSGEHNKPIEWIRQMTSEDPKARPTAADLLEEISNNGQAYCGTCCGEDPESEVSDADSYRGSDTEDEGTFASNSNSNTRSTDATSPPLNQGPMWQPPKEASLPGSSIGMGTETSTTAIVSGAADPVPNAGTAQMGRSPVQTSSGGTSGSTSPQATTRVDLEQEKIARPLQVPHVQSDQLYKVRERQRHPPNVETEAKDLKSRSFSDEEAQSRRSGSLPTATRSFSSDVRIDMTADSRHASQPSTTIRDPEGNDIRKALKKAFASELLTLEAHILAVREKREDWQDLLLQAIRPHDTTVNRFTILHALTRFEDNATACEVLTLYLSEDAEIDALDFASSTPLQHASYHNRIGMIRILLEAGAKCSYINFRKKSALGFACTQKHEEVAQLLMKNMSVEELNIKDAGGCTALHHACASGSALLVKALVEAGADSLAMDKEKYPPFWRCDDSIVKEISHFYRTWRATILASESPDLQDVATVSWWSTCDIASSQSDKGILKGHRAATILREPMNCSCGPCVVIGLAKQLSDAGSMPPMTCACSRHIVRTTEDILGHVATIETSIANCSCKTCTEARQECGKQSTTPELVVVCQCSWCRSQSGVEKNMAYTVPDLAAPDVYQGHEYYDNEIEKALVRLCDCIDCRAGRDSIAIRELAGTGFKGIKSYRTEPRFAWTYYIEHCLDLANESRRRSKISSMILDVLNILLDSGADINSTSKGFTMLHAATLAGNVALAKLLIDRNADLNAEAKDGETALMMALMKQDARMLRLLLRSGALVRSPTF